MRYACSVRAGELERFDVLPPPYARTRLSLAMLSESPKTDAAPCLFYHGEPFVTRSTSRPGYSWQQGAICKRAARSVELNCANYIIRTPHPTQERCDETTALLDA